MMRRSVTTPSTSETTRRMRRRSAARSAGTRGEGVPRRAVYGEERREEWLDLVEREHGRAIGEPARGIWMRLEEQRVDADRDRRARDRLRELARAPRLAAARPLLRVRDVVDDRPSGPPQDDERTHVDDEVAVAEGGSALREQDAARAACGGLLRGERHVGRR